jgi:hypothetical protein
MYDISTCSSEWVNYTYRVDAHIFSTNHVANSKTNVPEEYCTGIS